MLHLSIRALPSPFIICLAVLTMSRAAGAQQTPSATPGATPRSAVATPAVNRPAASGASIANRFLSQTTARLQSADAVNNVYHYVVAFPTKATSNLTITLQLNQSYRPSAKDLKGHSAGIKLRGVTFNSNAASHSATLKFFVPYSSLSPDVDRRLRALPRTASTRDATRASTQLVSYQYFPVGYQGGGQEGAPASSGGEEQGFWTTLVNETLKSGVEAEVADWINKAFPNSEAGEPVIEAASAVDDINEALTLNQEDSEILTEVMALENCAHNMPNAPPYLPEFQTEVDSTASEAKEDVAMQFLALMAKVAAGLAPSPSTQSAGINILGDGFFAAVANGLSETAAQQLQADLKTLRSLVPWCVANSWRGDYKITNRTPAIEQTTSWSGAMFFTVTSGEIKGTVNGLFKFSEEKLGPCNGEAAYTGPLNGRTTAQSPDYLATTWTTLPPTHIPVNGMWFAGTPSAHPCPDLGNVNNFELTISLVDGKPYTLCSSFTPNGPASCGDQLVQVISKTEITVTVYKAFTD